MDNNAKRARYDEFTSIPVYRQEEIIKLRYNFIYGEYDTIVVKYVVRNTTREIYLEAILFYYLNVYNLFIDFIKSLLTDPNTTQTIANYYQYYFNYNMNNKDTLYEYRNEFNNLYSNNFDDIVRVYEDYKIFKRHGISFDEFKANIRNI